MRLLTKLVALALCTAVVFAGNDDNDNNGNGNGNGNGRKKNCPTGLTCRDDRYIPHPQGSGYAGNPYDQNAVIYALFANPNPALLAGLPYVGIQYPSGVYSVIGQYAIAELSKLETPLFIRGNTLVLAAVWNSQTYFSSISPLLYSPNAQFPFASQAPAASNTVLNQNIACAYAIMRMSEYLTPKGVAAAGILANPPFGIDITYRGASNLSDARDIGNIAAAATIAYAKQDGWNSESAEFSVWKHPYSDNSGFVPVNDAYELKNIAKWQPLIETKDDGYFTAQTHVTAQIKNVQRGYAVTGSQLQTTYKFTDDKLMFQHDGSRDDPLTKEELALLKSEVDIVLQASANLNDERKSVAQLFDAKALSFAYMPINCLADFSYTFLKTLALDLGVHLSMLDATVVSWREKIRINQVRPVSALRYFYGNTQVNAFAGPYQGTQTINGADWNSFLRTMPHSDFPSGTSCICVAAAEFIENFRGTPGTVNLRWDFAPGSNMREPGTVPAGPITKVWGSTQDFINGCAYSRVDAGVHFNKTVTSTISFCKGLGNQVWSQFKIAAQNVL